MAKQTDIADEFIGEKIKLRRIQMGLSQADVGKLLKLTYQQFQKYEKGTNRVPASRLYKIAKILRVPVNYFFEGIEEVLNKNNDDKSNSNSKNKIHSEKQINANFNKDILKMNKFFSQLRNKGARKALINVLRCLVAREEVEKSKIRNQK